MCGICGFLSLNGDYNVTEDILRQMTSAQRHRGPDDEGYLCEAGVGLGFRRLAILDLTPAGHQPMSNEDGTVWLVFNGEIYNFQDLVPTLEQAGHRFRSRSDSEVIIHAYEQWGTECLQRFVGMFAFAIWDSRKRTIFLARDRMGEKPLYYWSDGSHFAFSSEVKALLSLPSVPRELNLRALQSYLVYEYVPSPESIFTGIRKLPAAHFLKFQLDGSAQGRQTTDWDPQQYWDVRFQESEESRRSVDDYAQELRELLKKAVARCLISDVPLGVFLSGGLDSSSIVAMMTEVSNTRPKTFSIGFAEKTYNESDYAQIVARHFDTEHHVEILNPDANDLIHTIANILDEPFADGQRLSTFASHIPPTPQKKGMRDIMRRFLEVAILPREMQHTRWQTFWQDDDLAHLLTIPENERSAAVDPRFLALFAASGSLHSLDQQQYADLKRYLPDDILFKVDRMSMAVSLETRGPLMDYKLVEFAARLPMELRLNGLSTKYLLKRAMRDILPQQILRRPKLGFNIPYKNWLRNELSDLLQDALSPARLRQQGIFQPLYVQKLIQEHKEGVRDHAHKLWQLLIFQLWSERYLSSTITGPRLIESRGVLLS